MRQVLLAPAVGLDPAGLFMRITVVLLLVVHGLIHVLGVLKTWNLSALPQMSGRTLLTLPTRIQKSIAALWVVACLLFLTAGFLLLCLQSRWFIIATLGVVLSQLLVIYAWPDAKAGTLPNLVLALAVTLAWADARFQRETERIVNSLLARVPPATGPLVAPPDLTPLPPPVRQWLQSAGIVGRPRVRFVRLRQRGYLRTGPEKGWMPLRAEQYFSVDDPGFVWAVRAHMLGLFLVTGRDSYLQGQGRMLIEPLSLVPVVEASGKELDQGAALRFLGEIVWFPSAALAPYISWEEVDARSARATIAFRGLTASAVFTFSEDGRFKELNAERYMGTGPNATLERWWIPASEWGTWNGIWMPIRGDVIWRLRSADFDYYRFEITEVEYDHRQSYAP